MDKNFSQLEKILHSTSERQKVLASNIANAETPGYKAKDIKFDTIMGEQMKLSTTSPRHINKTGSSSSGGKVEVDNRPSWGDGNNVELNNELAKMQENLLRHNAAIKLINKKISMYKSAIRGGR